MNKNSIIRDGFFNDGGLFLMIDWYWWVIIGLVLFIILKLIPNLNNQNNYKSNLIEKYGVVWDSNFRMKCLLCNWPLKYSSKDTSVLFCVKCNQKHVLRNSDGNIITEANAIKSLRRQINRPT